MKKKILTLIFIITLLPIWLTGQNNDNFEISKNLDVFTTLYRELHKNYVDEIQSGDLMNEAIDAMLNSLDPYTTYIPESEIEDYKFMTTGQYGGIGALIHKQDDYVIISELYEGFPAEKNGLKPGDKILKINGESAKDKSPSDVSQILKGQPGTTLTILLERPGFDEPIQKEIERETIKIDNVPYYGIVADNIGYIKLTGFTQNAWKNVRNAFKDLKEKNKLKGVIIDVRGNSGGLLNEAVQIANIFIKKGEKIVSTKGRLVDKNKVYKTRNVPIDSDIPVTILVNNTSASASEILAGAIQDLDRGVITGQRTYGKGLVQNVLPLSYNSKAKITVAKYYIPSGRCIQSIDYSHKDDNGNSHKVPDSLISKFETKNGRIVYDGGGIRPDIEIEPDDLSNITKTLFTKFLIFDYANKFEREHDTIPPVEEFTITDLIYNDFLDFISDKDYKYTTSSEKALEKLVKKAKDEKYFDAIEEEYEDLKSKMMQDKENDLFEFKDEISKILEIEIVSRYYYQKGKIKASIKDDRGVDKAIEIINNTQQYEKILQPDKS